MKTCRSLPQFAGAYQCRSTHFNIPLPRESPFILWLAARRQGRAFGLHL
jgi:hypothetical protein